jgi:ribosomal protein S27E
MPKPSGTCPQCGKLIVNPVKFYGLWDGRKPDGTKTGGPVYKTTCKECGMQLISFSSVKDDKLKWSEEQTTLPKISN